MIGTKFDIGEKVWYLVYPSHTGRCDIQEGEIEYIDASKGVNFLIEKYKIRCWPNIIKGDHVFKTLNEAVKFHQDNYKII